MSLLRSSNAPDRAHRLALLAHARLYLCTPARTDHGDLRSFLHAVYEGGVDIVQLRDKSISISEEIAALEILAEVAREHGKLFAVNDRADIAALVGADIFHSGQDDLTISQARALLGPDVVMGLSTHSVDQAERAMEDAELDYFCTGPLWETPTKPGRPATGVELVTDTASMLAAASSPKQRNKPWFTIGGINVDTIPAVRAAVARGRGTADAAGGAIPLRVVVVRALTEAHDPRAAAKELRTLLD